MLGPGWRHSFDHRLTLATHRGAEVGRILYEAPTGNRLRFLDTGDIGPLAPFAGVHADLVRTTSGYTLTMRDQSLLLFGAGF